METCIGNLSRLSRAQVLKLSPTCFKLLQQLICCALQPCRCRGGTITAAKIKTHAIRINNSITVNACAEEERIGFIIFAFSSRYMAAIEDAASWHRRAVRGRASVGGALPQPAAGELLHSAIG